MALVEWTSAMEIGDSLVDNQHKTFFGMVNTLHDGIMNGTGREIMGPTLRALANYTVEHFRTEEDLMTANGYPAYARHKEIHDDLVKKVTDLVTQFEGGKMVLPMTLSRFLADWILEHIKQEDMAFFRWMHNQA